MLKKDMIELSIISPVYNVSDYLDDFLSSLENQTISKDKIEIILVDDGSTDNSLEKLKSFEKSNFNVTVYNFEQASGAAGRPRNKGLELSKGKFIIFLDPDDVLPIYSLEILLNFINNTNSDVVGSQFCTLSSGRSTLYSTFINSFNTEVAEKGNNSILLKHPPAIWSKIYRKEFIMKNNIRFLEGVISQDFSFNFETLLYSDRVSYLPIATNFYRIRNKKNKSVTHNITPKYFEDLLSTRKYMANLSFDLYKNYIESDIKFALNQLNKTPFSSLNLIKNDFDKYLKFLYNCHDNTDFKMSRKLKLLRKVPSSKIKWLMIKIAKRLFRKGL